MKYPLLFYMSYLLGIAGLVYAGCGISYDLGIELGRRLERESHNCGKPPMTRIQIDNPDGERIILYGWFTEPKKKERYPK